jgi:hypothetical protein
MPNLFFFFRISRVSEFFESSDEDDSIAWYHYIEKFSLKIHC